MNNIVFIYGEDNFTSRQMLNEIISRYSQKYNDLNIVNISGEKATIDELTDRLQGQPLLVEKRLVIIKNLLISGKKEVRDGLENIIKNVPPSTLAIFFEDGVPDKRTSAFSKMKSIANNKYFPFLGNYQIRNFITSKVRKQQVEIEESAISLLAEWYSPDLWMISSQLDKLISHGDKITCEKIYLLCNPPVQAIAFDLTDSIVRGDRKEAFSILDKLRYLGENEVFLLTMIASVYRSMILVALAKKRSLIPGEIAKITSLHPFVVNKSLGFIKNRTINNLINDYQTLHTIDLSIKTGKIEVGTALDLLITRLVSG